MKLVPVASLCTSGACPTAYAVVDSGDVVMQGYVVPESAVDGGIPSGEALVRLPRQLLLDAAAELRQAAR